MNRKLQAVFDKASRLPPPEQAELASNLERYMSSRESPPIGLAGDERATILQALDQARRGAFASDDEIDDLLRKPW